MIIGLNILWFGINNVWYFIYVVKCTNFFLQLELATWCFWTFKATNVSCNKLCGFFFTKNKLFLRFQSDELIKHIIYNMWKPKFKKKYFILFSCSL